MGRADDNNDGIAIATDSLRHSGAPAELGVVEATAVVTCVGFAFIMLAPCVTIGMDCPSIAANGAVDPAL
jgi:hypothetical protein